MEAPEACRNHPKRGVAAACAKYGHGYCLECLESDPHCSDPEIYCKFRPQCIIFYHLKQRRPADQEEKPAMSQTVPYPDFIRALPQANIPLAGVTGFLLAAPQAQMVFFQIPKGSQVPAHSHGAQWGIVVSGRFDFTIAGQTRTYGQGDSYFVPAGAVHSAVFDQDCLIIEVFADADRYRPRD